MRTRQGEGKEAAMRYGTSSGTAPHGVILVFPTLSGAGRAAGTGVPATV